MAVARVTSKGQVTIPAEIRRSLDIHEGDGLLFESPKEDGVRLRVIRQRPLTGLAGALPATRSYPGKAAVREHDGQARGEDLLRKFDAHLALRAAGSQEEVCTFDKTDFKKLPVRWASP